MTTQNNGEAANNPGLVGGIISCVCAVLGFFIPFLGLILAIVGLVLGIRAYKEAKQANYQTGLVLGLIGSLISGISLAVAALVVLAMLGGVGVGLLSILS